MLLNFCLGCKKKKVTSLPNDDRLDDDLIDEICLTKKCKSSNRKSNEKSNSTRINVPSDQVDGRQSATSPSSICKFNITTPVLTPLATPNSNNERVQTPIHSITNDGSVRIKANAMNRALPDIPVHNLINTSLNSTPSSAIFNRSIDRSLTPPTTSVTSVGFNPNLSVNQSIDMNFLHDSSNSTSKFNCIATTSSFNTPACSHKSSINTATSTSSAGNSESQSIDDTNEFTELNKSDKREHHSYARIKDNVVIDSSTENDTDDYYDPSSVSKRGPDPQKVTINVPSASTHLDATSEINVNSTLSPSALHAHLIANEPTSSLYAVSNNLTRVTNLELPYHISTISTANSTASCTLNFIGHPTTNHTNNINNVYDLSADDEPAVKEVSYNKISVREPLAKVLADRAAVMEHHYTEVYDENNSFYEEIAGSTNSSVTYSKIGDPMNHQMIDLSTRSSNNRESCTSIHTVKPNNTSNNAQLSNTLVTNNSTNAIQIPVETSLLTIKHSSRSTSPMQPIPVLQTFLSNSNMINCMPSTSSFSSTVALSPLSSSNNASAPMTNNCEALYTQVNKSNKTNKSFLPVSPAQTSQQSNVNDLYAKVSKKFKISSHVDQRSSPNSENNQKKIHSSTPDIIHHNPPPPVPSLDKIPKNPKTSLFTIKSNSNLQSSDNTTSCATVSSFNQTAFNLNVYPQHKRSFSSGSQYADNDSDAYYETFPANKLDVDSHSYETVKKKSNENLLPNEDEMIDADYEIINYSTTNSAKQEVSIENSDEDSPCYEIINYSTANSIKKENSIVTSKLNSDKLDENDHISEPDYEVIKTTSLNKITSFKPTQSTARIGRKESDATDPGYERIRSEYLAGSKRHRFNESNDDLNYEIVVNNNDPNHFIERL